MNNDLLKNQNCLRGGCRRWLGAAHAGLNLAECDRCGFNKDEDQRRKNTPLTLCEDGLQRKIIPYKGPASVDNEEEEADYE